MLWDNGLGESRVIFFGWLGQRLRVYNLRLGLHRRHRVVDRFFQKKVELLSACFSCRGAGHWIGDNQVFLPNVLNIWFLCQDQLQAFWVEVVHRYVRKIEIARVNVTG